MSEMLRWKKIGAVFADDLGRVNPKFTYTGTSVVKSPYGLARSFNGTISDLVTIPHEQTLNFTTNSLFTIVMKLYIPSTSDGGYPLAKTNFTTGWSILYVSSTNVLNLRGDQGQTAFSITNPPKDTWFTVVYVHNGVNVTGYLNGVLNNSAVMGAITSNTHDILLGNRTGGGNTATALFEGVIKEVIIDTRLWSASDALNYHLNKNFDYDKNIVSRWNLDTTSTAAGAVKDLGWRNLEYNGTISGNPTLSNNPFGGNCLNLDGTGDFVTINNIPQPNAYGAYTSSIWFKTSATGSDYVLYRNIGSTSSLGFRVWINGSTSIGGLLNRVVYQAGGVFIGSSVIVNDGNWHSVTVSWDGTNTRLFVDGVFSNSVTQGYSVSGTNGIGIGTNNTPLVDFNGCVSNFIVFDKALSDLEVRDLYERQRSGLL